MRNPLSNNIVSGLILLVTVASFSACGSSSSSSSSTIPSSSTVYYVHNLVFKNGTTLSTGYNAFGQLGTGNLDLRTVAAPLLNYFPFKGFATGGNHSVAFFNSSTVRSWGYNYTGQLGNGTTTYSNVPVKTGDISGVTAVAAGAFHSLALKGDGSVWSWGLNDNGQLGYPTPSGYSTLPRPIIDGASGIPMINVSAIAANGYNSLALVNGVVWGWGSNQAGQLGVDPTVISSLETPLAVNPLTTDITAIAAGSAFTYAVDGGGTIWALGNNSNGQLGNGTLPADANIPDTTGLCTTAIIPSYKPVQVSLSAGAPLTGVVQVAAGYHHGLARLVDGSVYAWGANLYGQLGTLKVIGNSCYAVKVELKDSAGNYLKVTDIRAFGSSSMAMTEDGTWYVWGNNLFGQLGVGSDGANSTVVIPKKMAGF